MICAISPSQSCKSETFSTLRFAQRAKAMKNKAVVNEIKQDDVNVLRDQIRQLKDELLRMKSGASAESNGNYSTGWNARKSLNLLRMSLCRPAKLPVIDDDNDEEMEIDEEDVEHPEKLNSEKDVESQDCTAKNGNGLEREEKSAKDGIFNLGSDAHRNSSSVPCETSSPAFDSSIDLNCPILEIPQTVDHNSKEGANQMRCGKSLIHLEASLHHGLEILDNRTQKSPVSHSSVGVSIRAVDVRTLVTPVTNDIGVQTIATDDNELTTEKSKKELPKAVERVLAGAIRREMALEDHCSRQKSEIGQLKRLIQQYKHERECNALIDQLREERISRLENLMDGFLPSEEFKGAEFASLTRELKLLREKYDNHPEVIRMKAELMAVQDELERYRNFFDMDEREVLTEEIQDLKTQLQHYVDNSSRRRPTLGRERECEEREWVTQLEELQQELEASRSLTKRLNLELESEKKCSEELKEALHAAMEGHTRILDQYADLQEKHMSLLTRHQQVREGIEEVKRAAAKAGVKGAESTFVDSLAAQVSALRVERERERRYWIEESKGLRSQLKDMAEAVEAAGELLVRLKEAEEASAAAQERTERAEKEAERARREIEKLKEDHEKQLLAEAPKPAGDGGGGGSVSSQKWREEFEDLYHPGEFSRGAEEASWFSRYDQCNM